MMAPTTRKIDPTLIVHIIRFWLSHQEESEKVRAYEQGYARNPEPVDEIKALEQLSADAFKEEGWQ